MKYLNLGCGSCFSTDEKWVNLDFNSYSNHVIRHNILNGIPFENDYFDLVYHSHVLEHFNKDEGLLFLKECNRVLKPGGILRIVVPNLEEIVKEYLKILNLGIENILNDEIEEKYNWILLELFDQMIRKYPGGEMGLFLEKEDLKILDYIEKIQKIKLVKKYDQFNQHINKTLFNRRTILFLIQLNFNKNKYVNFVK